MTDNGKTEKGTVEPKGENGGLGGTGEDPSWNKGRQVNQITATTNNIKPKSISLGVSDSSNSPSLSNKFEILSQLEEELND